MTWSESAPPRRSSITLALIARFLHWTSRDRQIRPRAGVHTRGRHRMTIEETRNTPCVSRPTATGPCRPPAPHPPHSTATGSRTHFGRTSSPANGFSGSSGPEAAASSSPGSILRRRRRRWGDSTSGGPPRPGRHLDPGDLRLQRTGARGRRITFSRRPAQAPGGRIQRPLAVHQAGQLADEEGVAGRPASPLPPAGGDS